MLRRVLRLVAVAALATLSGCGLGPGNEQSGDGAAVRVTRDFGRELLSSDRFDKVREGQTVMRALQSRRKVKTRFGGGFVQSIDGLSGEGAGATRDWFFYVNGIEAGKGAAEYDLSPGDVVQWDHRDWVETMDVRAIVGAFPEPFLHGLDAKRFPVRVECEDVESDPCEEVKATLEGVGVPATGAALGASGNQDVIRVVVATWPRARELPSAKIVEQGPKESGVFARYDKGGQELDLLDDRGDTVRTEGAGTGLIAALRPADTEIVWLVTGGDEQGLANAAAAFDAATLRDAFAVAATEDGPVKLPLEASP